MNWHTFLEIETNKPYFKNLNLFLEEEEETKVIFPKKEDRFNAFKLTEINNVKVVIIGQDPYHGMNQAHGLAFSTLDKKLPPSLKNIFKELNNDLNIPISTKGDLTSWAEQGVLLLNTILTVESASPLSHKDKGWEIFTSKVINLLNDLNQPIVFILWGSHAKTFKKALNNPMHLVIESNHPSPLSAYRGFFDSKPFSQVNKFLLTNNVKPIDWEIK